MTKENKIHIYETEDFEKWLKKNHEKESNVAVILHKKHTGKKAPTHRQQIEVAICYGWIDTTVKTLDEDTYQRVFMKRTKNSRWSENTISYAKALKKQGKMSKQGLHFFELGLKKPTHDQGIPKNPTIPKELKEALEKNKKAKENFNNFPPSHKKYTYRWILRAKLDKTKEARIKKIVEGASRNQRVF